MGHYVFILEDNPARTALMRAVLAEILPAYKAVFTADAPSSVAWLRGNLANVVLVSLDHDLDSIVPVREQRFDPGTGRHVSGFLAVQPPVCPVIVHTSNELAGSAMVHELRKSEWVVFRTYPRDDMDWIATDWASDIRALLQRGLIFA